MMESAVSSSEATSFLKCPAVSFTYQNGMNMSPAASTGTRKTLPIMTAADAPMANSSKDAAQIAGNLASFPVAFRMVCVSSISRRRKDFFLRCVLSLISVRMLFGAEVRRWNTPWVKSMGEMRRIKKAPAIMPTKATKSKVVKRFPPPS